MAFTPTQLPSGRWRSGFLLPDGKKVQRTFDYAHEAQDWANQAEAQARLDAVASTMATLAPEAPVSITTISQHGALWLAGCGDLARSTRDGYAWSLRVLADTGLGTHVMSTVKRSDVKVWRTAMLEAGIGRPSINAHQKVLRMVYLDALAEGVVAHDPTHGLDYLKAPTTEKVPLTVPQQVALLDATTTDTTRAMVLLGLDAGLRYSEAAGLNAASVLGDYLLVQQVLERSTSQRRAWTKSGKPRVVPMTQRLADAMAPLVAAADGPDALVVTTDSGAPLLYDNFRHRVWAPLTYRAGLVRPRPGFHHLRHTYGSTLAANNVPTPEIQKLMGHSDQKTTERYIHAGSDGRRLALVREALGA